MTLRLKDGSGLVLRAATPQEMNLIKSDWFRSFRRNGFFGHIDNEILAPNLNARLDWLTRVCPPVVATLEEVPDEVIGWVCRDLILPIVNFVYIKHDFRRQGLGSALVFGVREHTHDTISGRKLAAAVRSRYNPFLLEQR